jgi:diguanylate cyclase (GGDEF)-like protein
VIEVASSRLRTYDAMFRYGGEEFLFCLPNAAADVAMAAMERVRSAIERTIVELGDGQSVSVTASFGVAPLSPTDSIEESIKEADRALFGAKAGGRNRVCRWDVR